MKAHLVSLAGMLLAAASPALGQEPLTAAGFVPRMYKGLDPRLAGAAEMSVTAHLIDLERRGLAIRSEDLWTAQ